MTRKGFMIVALAFLAIFSASLNRSGNGHSGVAFAQQTEQRVVFNTKTRKYHGLNCKWAIKCTKSCITLSLSEAKRRGGVPCKVCGGH